MPPEQVEAVWLTGDHVFSLAELEEISGLPESELRELVDCGAVTPVDPESSPWMFSGKCLLTVRTACRLRISLDLETGSLALMITLLEQIQDLEEQVRELRAQIPEQR